MSNNWIALLRAEKQPDNLVEEYNNQDHELGKLVPMAVPINWRETSMRHQIIADHQNDEYAFVAVFSWMAEHSCVPYCRAITA